MEILKAINAWVGGQHPLVSSASHFVIAGLLVLVFGVLPALLSGAVGGPTAPFLAFGGGFAVGGYAFREQRDLETKMAHGMTLGEAAADGFPDLLGGLLGALFVTSVAVLYL